MVLIPIPQSISLFFLYFFSLPLLTNAAAFSSNHIVFPPGPYEPVWRSFSSAIHFIGVSILAFCLARRTDKLSFRGFTSLPLTRWLIVLIFADSWLFIFSAGLLISGNGLSLNSAACSAGIYLCILLYATTKLLIYWFLVEKVHLVHPHSSHTRLKSPAYRLCMFFTIGYLVIIFLLLTGRISFIRDGTQPTHYNDHATDGVCVIGLGPRASLSLLVYDLLLNVFFTCMFLYPVYRAPNLSPRLKIVAKRTLIAALVALLTSAINVCVLTILHGKELGAVCLASCGLDTIVNALAIYAVTSPVGLAREEEETIKSELAQNMQLSTTATATSNLSPPSLPTDTKTITREGVETANSSSPSPSPTGFVARLLSLVTRSTSPLGLPPPAIATEKKKKRGRGHHDYNKHGKRVVVVDMGATTTPSMKGILEKSGSSRGSGSGSGSGGERSTASRSVHFSQEVLSRMSLSTAACGGGGGGGCHSSDVQHRKAVMVPESAAPIVESLVEEDGRRRARMTMTMPVMVRGYMDADADVDVHLERGLGLGLERGRREGQIVGGDGGGSCDGSQERLGIVRVSVLGKSDTMDLRRQVNPDEEETSVQVRREGRSSQMSSARTSWLSGHHHQSKKLPFTTDDCSSCCSSSNSPGIGLGLDGLRTFDGSEAACCSEAATKRSSKASASASVSRAHSIISVSTTDRSSWTPNATATRPPSSSTIPTPRQSSTPTPTPTPTATPTPIAIEEDIRGRSQLLTDLTTISGGKRKLRKDEVSSLEVSVVTEMEQKVELRRKTRQGLIEDYRGTQYSLRRGRSYSSSGGL
ncbi:hypothetical protein FRC19_004121 [Serendipita sp. 401]|nr:hypothetical protein FRC19_004121 [Serendipita sp. 401]